MQKLYTTKLINKPEMKFYFVLDYTLPSTWLKSTQAEIQNDSGSLGLVISLKNLFLFVSFDKEGINNVFIETVLPWFSNIYSDRQ